MTSQELESLVRPLLEELGFELVSAQATRLRRRQMFRVFVDKEGGVAISDCAFLSRRITQVLDRDPLLPGTYAIEVSSPGMDRPVRTLEHYRRFEGEKVHILLYRPREGRRRWTGRIAGVEGEEIRVAVAPAREEVFRLGEIQEAHLELDPWKAPRQR